MQHYALVQSSYFATRVCEGVSCKSGSSRRLSALFSTNCVDLALFLSFCEISWEIIGIKIAGCLVSSLYDLAARLTIAVSMTCRQSQRNLESHWSHLNLNRRSEGESQFENSVLELDCSGSPHKVFVCTRPSWWHNPTYAMRNPSKFSILECGIGCAEYFNQVVRLAAS